MVSADDDCVSKVIDEGKPQDQAVAICINKKRERMSELTSQVKLKTASLSLTGNFKKKLDF